MSPARAVDAWRLCLLHLAGVAVLLAVPHTAQAYNVQTVGEVANLFSSVSGCRGAKVLAERDATVVGVSIHLQSSIGNLIDFYAYEASPNPGQPSSTYARIESATVSKDGTVDSSPAWEDSPPMMVEVVAGTYYVFLACWDTAPGQGFSYGLGMGTPEELSFGEFVEGVGLGSPTPAPSQQSWFNLNLAATPAMRLTSSAGEPVDVEPAFESAYSGPYSLFGPAGSFRGNAWAVDEDRVLLGFDQRFSLPPNLPMTGVEWAVYRCWGTDLNACGAGAPLNLVDTGPAWIETDPSNGDRWVSFDHLQVQLEAGYVYFVGAWWDAVDIEDWQWDLASGGGLVDPDWGTSLAGVAVENSLINSSVTLHSANVAQRSAQHLVTVQGHAATFEGMDADMLASGEWVGTVFEVTSNTRLKQFAVQSSDYAGSEVVLGLFESSQGPLGPWVRVTSRSIELQGAPTFGWKESGPLDIDLLGSSQASGWYVVTLSAAPNEWIGWNYSAVPPVPTEFGSRYGSASWSGVQPMTSTLPQVPFTTSTGPTFRLESCADCLDMDEDGFSAGEDCDDENPDSFPGNPEVCDGADNDCDGLLLAIETDDDGDGLNECIDGDCDDADPSNFPGNSEACDGQDNDCDGAIPTTEIDQDGDGVAECSGDCDETDETIFPGNTEVCDQQDNNCDGVIPADETDDDGDGLDECVGEDCDDADPSNFPGNVELCDGQDNDCDGVLGAEEIDNDGDGFDECSGDCDDATSALAPGNTETCDGRDNDCDGLIPDEEIDADEDGVRTCDGDCDDLDPGNAPNQSEVCDDGQDNNCDGLADADDPTCEGEGEGEGGEDPDGEGERPPPDLVDSDLPPPELIGGCAGCSLSPQPSRLPGSTLLVLVILALFGLRRRISEPRFKSGSRKQRPACVLVLLAGLLAPGLVQAQTQSEIEGQRQLDFAWEELDAEKWDRALTSASSAMRLAPSLYTAMLVKALAFEGKGELKRSQSWFMTYLDITQSRPRHAKARELHVRLEAALSEKIVDPAAGEESQRVGELPRTVGEARRRVEASGVAVRVRQQAGAFGQGYVLLGGIGGLRHFRQSPCGTDGACNGSETRPGFWDYSGLGGSGGASLRAEVFFGGWYLGARLRYDLGTGQPVFRHGLVLAEGLNHRVDGHFLGRIPLTKHSTTAIHLLLDLSYGLRTWTVFENLGASEASRWVMAGSELGGGLGLRIEPGRRIGVELRLGTAGLLAGTPGLNEVQGELALGLRPVGPLAIRVAADFRRTLWTVQREDRRAEAEDIAGGLWIGAGLSF
ncbi:MAG: putative metal-binding motif-containing protein [Myxococcota bacterium]|nr:putative metal-binding motif-containing protein [Myxococcota bacterium]